MAMAGIILVHFNWYQQFCLIRVFKQPDSVVKPLLKKIWALEGQMDKHVTAGFKKIRFYDGMDSSTSCVS